MKRDIHKFDTSKYDVIDVYNMPRVNKKVLGLMKDKNNAEIMCYFAGSRSKCILIRFIKIK